MIRLPSAAAVVAVLALTGGCALLSSPDPVQLYRFGGDLPATGERAAPVGAVQVQLRRVEFPEASGGDRILGVTGVEAAYIGGVRWVSPAADLFGAGLEATFAERSQRVRLIGRRELTPATAAVDVDVRTFEARYEAPGAAPTVVVSARARLLDMPGRTVRAEQTFTVSQPTGANSASAIVEAFDVATRDLNTRIVDWTDASVAR